MKKLFIISAVFLVCIFPVMGKMVYGQANRTNVGDVACAASGSSTQVMAARSGRYSYSLNNTSGTDVRIGYLDSGTANLTTSNSWLLKAGQPYSDSTPGVLTNRIVCMSTSAGTATISFIETYR